MTRNGVLQVITPAETLHRSPFCVRSCQYLNFSVSHQDLKKLGSQLFYKISQLFQKQDLNSVSHAQPVSQALTGKAVSHGSQYLTPSISRLDRCMRNANSSQIKSVMVRHTYMYLIKKYCKNTLVKPIGGTRSVETLFEYKTPAGVARTSRNHDMKSWKEICRESIVQLLNFSKLRS